MMLSDADFLRLFNVAALASKTPNNPPDEATSLDATFADLGIDSLDAMIVGMYLCDVYKVPEEVGKTLRPKTVGEFKQLLEQAATVTEINVEEAIESIK